MNNFLRQFGNFKKNSSGLNEYVDYLGTHYIQDPKTGQWKNNGRTLNEQMFAQEAMNAFGGYGDENSGGKKRTNLIYTLGFAESQNQTVAMANPFDDLLTNNGEQTSSEVRWTTIAHNQPVPIKLKLISKSQDYTPESAVLTFKAFPSITTRITFNLLNSSVNDESSTYTIPAPPFIGPTNPTAKFTYVSNNGGVILNGDVLEYGIQVINAVTNEVIDSFVITDTADLGG
jgi:hypothetical protein